jgi:alpha-tubulin suppressor-like RCC1 family protein
MFHLLAFKRVRFVVMALLIGLMLLGGVVSLRAQAQSIGLPENRWTVSHANDPARSISAASSISITALWGGARSAIILKSDGTVWTFGVNNCGALGVGVCGKLGDGTIISRSAPIQVHGPGNIGYLTSITAIMAGEHENYAIKSDGTLWAWGGNFVGQLGDGTFTNTVTPVQVSGLISVTMLGGRGYHNLAVTADGKVWAWGWNSRGQLGNNGVGSPSCPLSGVCSNVPVQVIGITNPLTVTGGGFFSLALMPDHTLHAWGANEHGQLADGSTTDRLVPVHASSILSNVVQVSAGWKHAVALTADGKVWTWGDNNEGAIGNGVTSTIGVTTPFQVPGLSNVIGVSAGDRFTGILKADGTVWTWGALHHDTQYGQLGTGVFAGSASPVKVTGLTNVILYSARDYHNLAVKADGSLWAWGSGDQGELGNCAFQHSALPVQVMLPPLAQPSIISPLIVTGTIGLPFTYTISATGCPSIVLGAAGLPAWATLNGSIISGTPNIMSTSRVTLTANSSFGSDTQLLQINIFAPYDLFLPLVLK